MRKDVLKEIPRIGMALAATAQCPEEQEEQQREEEEMPR
jgi:hypothetical protein